MNEMDMWTKESIYTSLRSILTELFEVEDAEIVPEALLYENLDIDSIDAVDMIMKLKQLTGKRIEPSEFKSVRTVQDVVDAIYELMNGN